MESRYGKVILLKLQNPKNILKNLTNYINNLHCQIFKEQISFSNFEVLLIGNFQKFESYFVSIRCILLYLKTQYLKTHYIFFFYNFLSYRIEFEFCHYNYTTHNTQTQSKRHLTLPELQSTFLFPKQLASLYIKVTILTLSFPLLL
jgi:hypothetical protein